MEFEALVPVARWQGWGGKTNPQGPGFETYTWAAGIAASTSKFGYDLRLLAHLREVEEPYESEQIGSSAMAYKRNPMRCERATGLSRFVISLANSPLATAAEQWFERTLDDSSNRRLSLPEPFLAIDGALMILIAVQIAYIPAVGGWASRKIRGPPFRQQAQPEL